MDAAPNEFDMTWTVMCRGVKESLCVFVLNVTSLLDTSISRQKSWFLEKDSQDKRIRCREFTGNFQDSSRCTGLSTLCNEMSNRPPDPVTSILS